MNKTKQRVLVKSLKLFNAYGVSNVSLRNIADEAEISVGNLQYHFKKREEIVETLYFQLVEKIDGVYFLKSDNLLQAFLNISTDIIKIFYEYHFFLLDFVTITRNNQKIKNHYSKLSKRREKEFLEVVHVLVNYGLIREELLKNEYFSLFKRIEVITNFWFSSVLIQTDVLSKKSIDDYSIIVHQSIYPYLTEQAKTQYISMTFES